MNASGRQAWIRAALLVGVVYGALGLAVAGMIHSLSTAAAIRRVWLLALVIWPAVTAVPAFLVAFVAGAVLKGAGR